MIGIDSNILVAHAVPEHPFHRQVRRRIGRFIAEGRHLALTSGILAEFIHIVTDPKRFEKPLNMVEALEWAEFWSDAVEVVLLAPDTASHSQWLRWLREYRLGRKRLLDTLVAANWCAAGIREIFTLNPKDFKIFGAFTIHTVRPSDSG